MITVTGAAGLTGRHVIAGLLNAGLPVRALAHSPASAGRLPSAKSASETPETVTRCRALT